MNLKRLTTLMCVLALGAWLSGCASENSGGGSTAAGGSSTAEGGSATASTPVSGAAFRWDTTEHDFGTITEGENVTYKYKFTNVGTANLILEEVKPSCGCTTPDWTREPIPPGGTGFITVSFDSNGKSGAQNKSVTVIANTEPRNVKLTFRANVVGGENG